MPPEPREIESTLPAKARALWVTGPSQSEIRSEALRSPEPGEVLVQAVFSAISRGTESLVYRGAVPPTEYERMRAPFQEGQFPAPVKYGYSSVGIVRAGPSAHLGKAVFCLFPHQTHYVAAADRVVAIPPTVPLERAVLAANMETAINGLWDSGVSLGDRVAIVGGGVVGCLLAHLAQRIPGCDVQLLDLDPRRRTIADGLGVRFAAPVEAERDFDAVFEASGSGAGLRTALELVRPEGIVVAMSWYGREPVELPLGGAFHARRVRIQSSQVGNLPVARRPTWTFRRRLELAIDQLVDPRLDVLFTGQSHLEQLPDELPNIFDPANGTVCHRIVYGSSER